MADDGFMGASRSSRTGEVGGGAIRITLLFGSAAVALALIAAPVLDRSTRGREASLGGDLDMMSTGSTPRKGSSYVIRRSVLQHSPSAICVIRANGTRSGDC